MPHLQLDSFKLQSLHPDGESGRIARALTSRLVGVAVYLLLCGGLVMPIFRLPLLLPGIAENSGGSQAPKALKQRADSAL